MTTKTKPTLDAVVKAVTDAGFPLTEQELEVVHRRLARNERFNGRPDPLSGAETDPVKAVDSLYDERGGPLARNVEGPPPVATLLDGYEPEPGEGEDDLEAENARLRAEVAALRSGGPAQALRAAETKAASAGPTDDTSGQDEHLAATVGQADKDQPKDKEAKR